MYFFLAENAFVFGVDVISDALHAGHLIFAERTLGQSLERVTHFSGAAWPAKTNIYCRIGQDKPVTVSPPWKRFAGGHFLGV